MVDAPAASEKPEKLEVASEEAADGSPTLPGEEWVAEEFTSAKVNSELASWRQSGCGKSRCVGRFLFFTLVCRYWDWQEAAEV